MSSSPSSSSSSVHSLYSHSSDSVSSSSTITPASHSTQHFHKTQDSLTLFNPAHSTSDSRSFVINNKPFKMDLKTPLLFPEYPLHWGKAIKKNLAPSSGDINAFFAVMLDNIANLATLATLLHGFGIPYPFIYQNMFPGTAISVMLGCFALAAMAIYLDRHNREVETRDGEPYIITAIPLGLDAPTTIGLPLIVIGPAFINASKTKSEMDAAQEAWELGCATVVMIGLLKLVLAVFGERIQHLFHAAGKQGALSAIGLCLLGFVQLTTVLEEPVPGLISLWFLLLVVVSRYDQYSRPQPHQLPYRVSGVLVAAIVGCVIYYSMAAGRISIKPMPTGLLQGYTAAWYPRPCYFYNNMVTALKTYGSIAIPYAILVNIGGMSVVAAAKAEGNAYSVTAVQVVDAVCTLAGGFLGGVIQTTPYIGHTVYHKTFKCRSFYTVANGLFIGLGGLLGYISLISEILPSAAVLPIFIFVAFEIVYSTFHDETKVILPQHTPALIFAIFPAIAQILQIVLSQLYTSPQFDITLMSSAIDPTSVATSLGVGPTTVATIGSIVILAHGFIATSLLWGSALAFVIDKKLGRASFMLFLCALFTFFGVIHSVDPNGDVYLPWKITPHCSLPYHWVAGYLSMAFLTFISSWFIKPEVEDIGMLY